MQTNSNFIWPYLRIIFSEILSNIIDIAILIIRSCNLLTG